jgi:hypothetical protein
VGLVYDPRKLSRVTTARPGVPRVLQMVSESSLAISRARTGQGRAYIRKTLGSSGRDTVWYVCC